MGLISGEEMFAPCARNSGLRSNALSLRNELTAGKSLCECLMTNGKVPGYPGNARRPGRPPSPRCWPAPVSGWTSRADAGPSGHGAGLLVARTFVNKRSRC